MESHIIIAILAMLILYKYLNMSEITYEKYVDENNKVSKYLVRNMPDKKQAVKTLAKIEKNLRILIKTLKNKDVECKANAEMYSYVSRIDDKIDDVEIQETPADSKYTSYSVNKGELLVFCIRSKKTFKIHDMNELLYVAIHEIAHIGCPEVGHTNLFFKINAYLLKKAMQYDIYKYIDYSVNNKEYCGMTLTTNVAS